jgi:hypothetical protein
MRRKKENDRGAWVPLLFVLLFLMFVSSTSLVSVSEEEGEVVEVDLPMEMGVLVDNLSEILDYAVKLYAVCHRRLPENGEELKEVLVVDFSSPETGKPFKEGEPGYHSLKLEEDGLHLLCWKWESVSEDGKRLLFKKVERVYRVDPSAKYVPAVSFSWLLERTMRTAELWWKLNGGSREVEGLKDFFERMGTLGGGFTRVPGGKRFGVKREERMSEEKLTVSLAQKLWVKLKGPTWIWGKDENGLWVRYLVDEKDDFVVSRYFTFAFPQKEREGEKEK